MTNMKMIASAALVALALLGGCEPATPVPAVPDGGVELVWPDAGVFIAAHCAYLTPTYYEIWDAEVCEHGDHVGFQFACTDPQGQVHTFRGSLFDASPGEAFDVDAHFCEPLTLTP
jgi:hypothetical protein